MPRKLIKATLLNPWLIVFLLSAAVRSAQVPLIVHSHGF